MKINGLSEIIKPRFRVGPKKGDYFIVLPYIDARDAMDILDAVAGPLNWSREDYSIDGKKHCKVGIYDGNKRTYKSDVGEQTNVAKDKGASSDAFKRACVNWGIGRFLYSMPTLMITSQEERANKYKITEYVSAKFKEKLNERAKEQGIKLEELKSKYQDNEEIADEEEGKPERIEEIDEIDTIEGLKEYYQKNKGKGKDFHTYVSLRKQAIQNANS